MEFAAARSVPNTRSGSDVKSYSSASAEAMLTFKCEMDALWRVKVKPDEAWSDIGQEIEIFIVFVLSAFSGTQLFL